MRVASVSKPMVVEEASDEPYLGYLANEVLATMQAPSREVQRGRTFVADQNSREPYYHSPYMSTNVFDPEGPLVEAPYKKTSAHQKGPPRTQEDRWDPESLACRSKCPIRQTNLSGARASRRPQRTKKGPFGHA